MARADYRCEYYLSYNYRIGTVESEMSYENRRYGAPRQMTKVKCSDCGVETEVPFVPTAGRPVYCRECYQKHRRY